MRAATVQKLLLIAFTLALFAAGCVNHQFFFNLTGEAPARYIAEGDSFDLYDGRIALPPGNPWEETFRRRERNEEEDTITWLIGFQAQQQDTIPHPVASPEQHGYFTIDEQHYILLRKKTLTAFFPGWHVKRIYGDIDEFVPEEHDRLRALGIDSILTEEQRTDMKRLEALGLQKGHARRYMYQMQNILKAWNHRPEADTISPAAENRMITDGLERFSAVLRAHMLTFRNRDPLEVSLEWYPELREHMVSVGVEMTSGKEEWFENVADSIDYRWKTWKDVEDDLIEIGLLLPKGIRRADPDSTAGDTLYWTIEGKKLAEGDVVINAGVWQPVWWADVILILIIAAGAFLLIRSK